MNQDTTSQDTTSQDTASQDTASLSTTSLYTAGMAGAADRRTRDDAAPPRLKASAGPCEGVVASARLRSFCAVLLLCAGVALVAAGPASSQQPGAGAGAADPDAQIIDDLVKANHILAKEGVLDGFGHVSVRSLKNPKHFYMARSLAPALVTAADIMEFDENSQPVAGQPSRKLYSERFIHGEILRARPDVMAVVHSHSPDVLPFTVTNAPLKALIHTAAFLGSAPAPVFDSRKTAGDSSMLVRDISRGAALAAVLGTRSVVLMRGHGMAVAAPNVRQAVMRAIYTQLNARVEFRALMLGTPNFLDDKEAERIDPIDRRWEAWVAESER